MFLTEHTEFTERSKRMWFDFFASKKKQTTVLSCDPHSSLSVLSVNSSELNERVRVIRAFTLVELMLIMGVIVILVAMMFPVIIGAKEKARKKQALTEAHNIALALKGYRMEYGRWPNQSQAEQDRTYFTNNHLVIRPLIGKDPRENPRGKIFLAVQLLSTNTSAGLTNLTGQTDYSGNFVDPWGVPYVICINENEDTNCLINISNVIYASIFSDPVVSKSYSATNYSVANMDVAVASFANSTTTTVSSPFQVETWSEPR